MTSLVPPTQSPDELETLIDLLVDTADEIALNTPAAGSPTHAAIQDEPTDSLQAVPSFNLDMLGSVVVRHSTPIPSKIHNRAGPTSGPAYNVSRGASSPKTDDLVLPSFPPMTPYLPAVRAATPASEATTKKWIRQGDQPRLPDAPPATNPDLLPVSPFLLSPRLITQKNHSSRSPPFTAGSHEGSRANSPSAHVESLSQAGFGPLTNVSASRPHVLHLQEENHTLTSKMQSTAYLMEHLRRARTELAAVSRECEQLRQLVQRADLRAGLQTATGPPPLCAAAPQGFASDAAEATLIPQSTSSAALPVMDDVDRMSETEAKQKLKDVLAYLNLPVTSLESVPLSQAVVTPESPILSPFLSSTTSPKYPISQAPTTVIPSGPTDFSDVQRSLAFLKRIDELIWKRSLLRQFGIGISNRIARNHVAPLDLLRDGDRVCDHTSPLGVGGAVVQRDKAQATVSELNIFSQANVKALEERLIVWERAVRSRPRR